MRLDLLHDYASSGRLNEVTSLSRAELQGWLEEVIFTARETLRLEPPVSNLQQHSFGGRGAS